MIGKYKPSIFNYHIGSGDVHLIYNTLYHSLVRMNTDEYTQYLSTHVSDEELEYELIENGLWVASHIDERKRYLLLANLYTKNLKRPLSVTITTTLRCNARCVYCYEAGVIQEDFSPHCISSLISFIKLKNTGNGVVLNWFGGEPLMNTTVIDKVAEQLEIDGIPFISYIITNGSLLNHEMITQKFPKWHVHDIQITIDGTQKEYGKRKSYINSADNNFYQLLYHICCVAQADIYIHIRLNIDSKNIDEILTVTSELESVLGRYENVVFYPAFLTGSKVKLKEEQKIDIVYQLLNVLKNPKKIMAGSKFYSFPRIHACMKEDPNSFSVDVNGNLYDCEHLVGKPQLAIGTLEKGLFAGKDTRLTQSQIREDCWNCVFLPKCMGGCRSSYENDDCPCMIEKYLISAYMRFLIE